MTGLWLFQAAGEQLDIVREGLDTPLLPRLMGLVGMASMIGIAWLYSTDRRNVSWRLVGIGVALQFVLGVIVLKTPFGQVLFDGVNTAVAQILAFTEHGARFVFGNLARNNIPVGEPLGPPADMAPLQSGEMWANTGAYLAFGVLPTIIFVSSLMSVMYYLGIMQRLVSGVSWVMQRTMRTSGAETMSVAGNIFVGMTEAPLMIRPFIRGLTQSELHTVMVGGFATIAGGIMAAYAGMLSPFFPTIAGHLLTASVMNAPAAIVVSKILVPEIGKPKTLGVSKLEVERSEANVIEAAAAGASQGLQLALNVAGMLIAFVALLAMVNYLIGGAGGLLGIDNLTLEAVLGWIIAPLAWLMGVPWGDAGLVGSLVGIKIVATEFVAYLQLAGVLDGAGSLSPRATVIAVYALLGFANIPSIAVMIGGIGGIAPERRGDLSRLGIRAMIGGNLAAFMSASLAGMLA